MVPFYDANGMLLARVETGYRNGWQVRNDFGVALGGVIGVRKRIRPSGFVQNGISQHRRQGRVSETAQ